MSKPKQLLFYSLLTIYLLCMAGLIVLYFTTVRTPQKSIEPESTQRAQN